ncbi:MAG TPA: hypothetical protein VG456_07140 [Candidatus Sulfopaludibacter sp.]|jgi:hypothetical protein|nr:hypothetical protein [Candidatus Sulfopaludibacter sp.]
MKTSVQKILISCLLAWAAIPLCSAQGSGSSEIATLKAKLAEQQKQIDSLVQVLKDQQKALDNLSSRGAASAPGLLASTTPMLAPTPAVTSPRLAPPPQKTTADAAPSPLQIQLGNVTIMPVGFMDLTADWKDKNAGGSLGSNFGSVPYNTAATSKLGEFRFSPQNSRIGFRIDGEWKGTRFIGYNEFDFLGTSGANNTSVTNGAFVPRLRLFWVDLRKGKVEFLAGQSWSMLTPNRKGISALPGDLFYSQVTDVNYVAGLTWTRQPGVRVLYHPSEKVTLGLSLENPDQYMGGSGGSGSVTLPSALTGLANTQLDNQVNQQVPNVHPDIIAKIAFDPSSHAHIEFAGIERTFKIWNTTTGNAFSGQYSTKAGGGGSVNANLEVFKGFRLITNNYWSDGGGRYLFGQAPDVIVRADGSLSPIHSGGTVNGFEATVGKVLLYAYYGGIYVGRNVAVDANGTSLVGYGYRGSSNSQNKAIQEVTFGFNQTVWKDAKYGAINLMGQYEYLTRNPWYIAVNSPKATHDNTIYFNIRYTLPGGVPAMK